ncbi:PKD domain-containing protein [Nibrella saemangeumensis]
MKTSTVLVAQGHDQASGRTRRWLSVLVALLWGSLLPTALMAQTAPTIQWNKTIGGSDYDQLSSLQQTTDGGYIVGGWSSSNAGDDKSDNRKGSSDYWVVKLDANGNKLWDKTFGGSDNDLLRSLQQTTDGGYILGGSSPSNAGGDKTNDSRGLNDYWVIKLDASGNKVWDKTIGGSGDDLLYTVRQTTDGGYILGGHSGSNAGDHKTNDSRGLEDYWVVKLDANGAKVWDKTIGGSGRERFSSLQQTTDGGYILGGSSISNAGGDKTNDSRGLNDYWVVKLDANGAKVWDKTFGSGGDDYLTSLQQTTDGGYLLGGSSPSKASGDKTENGKGEYDYWVVKLDASGTKVWDKTIGGDNEDILASLQQTTDGGYILGGYSHSGAGGDKTENSNNSSDYWVVKLAANGTKVWDKTIGSAGEDIFYSLQQTTDGGYILGGYTDANASGDKTENSKGDRDYWVVKLNTDCSALLPSFTAAPVCLGSPTLFTNTTPQSGPQPSYSWDVNNDGTADYSTADVSHTYTAPGTYTATLTVTQGSCQTSVSQTVVVNALPTAGITANPGTLPVCAPTTLTLTATGGTQYTFAGPGVVSQDINAGTAVVNASGTYSVTVATATGCTSVTSITISTAQTSIAGTSVWTGCSSTDWNTAANWSGCTVPVATDEVVIPSGPANQPLIGAGTSAVAKSVQVRSGASLTIATTAVLTINGSATALTGTLYTAFYNEGTVQNSGQLVIGNSPTANVGNYGLWNNASFNNKAGGSIQIDRSTFSGLFNRTTGGTFINAGTITIGHLAPAGIFGLENEAVFSNNAGSTIQIDRSTGKGLFNDDGTFTNSATITIGTEASAGLIGLENEADFVNNAGGHIYIDQTTTNGMHNQLGSFTNAGTITIGAAYPVGEAALRSDTDFNNNACATLTLFAPLKNSYSFVNEGLFTVNTALPHTNTDVLTNNGIISYPLGNPIPNVTNNDLIVEPLVSSCSLMTTPALRIGGSNNFSAAATWYTDAAVTAGSYNQATNTFTRQNTLLPGNTYPLSFVVHDNVANCAQTVTTSLSTEVDNTPPSLTAKNATVYLDAQGQATITETDVVASKADNCGGPVSVTLSQTSFTTANLGDNSITITYRDPSGNTASTTATVTVQYNLNPPALSLISAPVTPVPVGTPISASATFTGGTVTSATWQWDDGSTSPATLAGGTIRGAHTYTTTGVYTLTLTVNCSCGQVLTQTYQYLVVYDPNGDFVTGGGWITSPVGAYIAQPSATGKANFGFVSKYKKGATVPSGDTQFEFKATSFKFESTAYEWLVVSGSKAQFKGEGTINGVGTYGFMLTAIDGDMKNGDGIDKFRIKIWNKAGGATVYDNNLNTADDANPTTALGGGSIVIHTGGKNNRLGLEPVLSAEGMLLRNYPNPVAARTTLEFMLPQGGDYTLEVQDLRGSVVKQLASGRAEAGAVNQVSWEAGASPAGVYIGRLITQQGSKAIKLLVVK